MEIRNLNTFLQVATLKNFTKAGEVLKYSQSNISAQIKQLEDEVGAPLFNRIGRNVSLTSYGEALLPYARQIVSMSLKIETLLQSEEALGGTVRVGMTDSLFELLLEDALINYHHRFPKVKLELMVDAAAVLTENLERGLLDIACIIHNPLPPTEWVVWDSVEVPIVLVANPNHKLVNQEKISLEELSKQDLILMEESAPYSQNFEDVFSGLQLKCQPFLRLKSATTAKKLVEREPFVSLLPLYTVQNTVNEGKVCILNVPQLNKTQLVQLVYHKNKAITPQIEGFLEELRLVLGRALAENL